MQKVKERVTRRIEQAQPRTERPDHWTCQHGGLLLMTLASMMPVEWGVEVRLEWVQGWRRGSMGCRHLFRERSSGVVAGGGVGSSPCSQSWSSPSPGRRGLGKGLRCWAPGDRRGSAELGGSWARARGNPLLGASTHIFSVKEEEGPCYRGKC